ncbi:MAG: DUF1566 domain-containing protein [Deltaproteobacteria bacterium]|nr:DUF1566 domain-containing protein [Deltaproteobacteria bacterium]
MANRSALLLAGLGLALAGCELIVDPARSKGSGSTNATNAANGASAAGSTSGSGAATGTGTQTNGSDGSGAGSNGSGSTHGASSGSTSHSTGSSGTTDTVSSTTGTQGSSGTSDSTGSTATSTVSSTNSSSASTSATTGTSSTSSTTGTSSTSSTSATTSTSSTVSTGTIGTSTTTATIGTATVGTTGTTATIGSTGTIGTTGPTTTIGTTGTTTTIGTTGTTTTIGTTGTTCAGYGSTGFQFTGFCQSGTGFPGTTGAAILPPPPLDAGGTNAGSGSGSTTTVPPFDAGGTGGFGSATTGTFDAGGVTNATTGGTGSTGTSATTGGAPISPWIAGTPPDSLASCSQEAPCARAGEDSDWTYPLSDFTADCGSQLNYSDATGTNFSATFAHDQVTGLTWQEDALLPQDTYNRSELACSNGHWTDASGNPVPTTLPPTQQLVELLDFGHSGDLCPDGLDSNCDAFWGMVAPGGGMGTYLVDFTSGAFTPFVNGQAFGRPRCMAGAPAAPPQLSDNCVSMGNGTQDCEVMSGSSAATPQTGLRFRKPAAPGLTWQQALDHCNNLGNACGLYRLPSYKELATLVNFTPNPTGSNFIKGLNGTVVYWTSTRAPLDPTHQAMTIQFLNPQSAGAMPQSVGTSNFMDSPLSVMCVTGP